DQPPMLAVCEGAGRTKRRSLRADGGGALAVASLPISVRCGSWCRRPAAFAVVRIPAVRGPC
ncbi:hypothetical protein, partial [Chromohalobacter sp. HP20-39]|uniref:hypothetical protein n=1 Tax=Chromohalobacter sp. HP20-39 TaxID=3079306 RepID=UPI00294AF094